MSLWTLTESRASACFVFLRPKSKDQRPKAITVGCIGSYLLDTGSRCSTIGGMSDPSKPLNPPKTAPGDNLGPQGQLSTDHVAITLPARQRGFFRQVSGNGGRV